MAEITKESIERFNRRFPETLTLRDIAQELDRMKPEDAEEFDTIFCTVLLNDLCCNHLMFSQKDLEFMVGSEKYKILKRRVSNLSGHIFYDAWFAFVEGRNKDVRQYVHEYIQTFYK